MGDVKFERVVNFRDFGGGPTADGGQVRRGVLYRSAHFGEATDGDIALLEQLGVRLVIDFRGPSDKEQEGHNRLPAGVREMLIPMYDPARGNDPRVVLYSAPPEEVARVYPPGRAFEAMLGASESFVANPERVRQYGEMLRAIIDADGLPILIHCSAGKDRTGWGAAVVHLALGVPREHIVADYMLSNSFRRNRATRLDELERAGLDPELLAPFFGVHENYINSSFDTVDRLYGGVEQYLRDGLGVDDDSLRRFRGVMIER
ncbi:MAG: tyrosine-protein phosphatase [Acidimicrobiales bacterium]